MNDERSIPLIRLFGNLIVPIQISLTDTLLACLVNDVTQEIERGQVSGLILDLSGVDLLDSHLTYSFRNLAVTARLMGIDTIVCGMRPAVVATIVEMGLHLSGVLRALNLERALELLINRAAVPEALPEHSERSEPERAAISLD